MIRVAICDDEIGTCSEIENMILNYARLQALQIDTEVFYSGETLFQTIKNKDKYDLVFLDIQLLQLDGVQVGKQIREQLGNEKISIVYISSKETYSMSLFQVRPLDFLIKPITQKCVDKTLDKYIRLNHVMKNDFFFHIGKSIQRLYLDEISYFACNGKKIDIYTDAGVTSFYGTMQEVAEQVNGKGFWVIHKSYIVNSSYFKKIFSRKYKSICVKNPILIWYSFSVSRKDHYTAYGCFVAANFILGGLNWIILRTCFHDTFVENKQCVIGAGIAAVIFLILELVLEKWKKSKSEQERELLEQEIRMYENQFKIIRQSQIDTRSLKHDMKHHLKMLSDLVSSGNNNAALKYLSDMGAFIDNTEEFVSSGNERIDSILNYMIGKAQNANIHISWKIQIPEQIEISTFDINVILSNLLDNALNALEDIPNPNLEILMKYDRGLLCISIQNNCSHEQAAIFHAHSVSQPDNEHGYGLKYVQRIVKKYHGRCRYPHHLQ